MRCSETAGPLAVFFGRVGAGSPARARSVRLPLEQLATALSSDGERVSARRENPSGRVGNPAALASLGCPSGKPRQAGSVRNVVLVTINTLRADRVGAYGWSAQATPHLDRLASRGVVFENAFTTAPLTLPAHASILSGLWPFRHGARVNGADAVSGDAPLLAARLLLGRLRDGR